MHTDLDECRTGINHCSENADCSNTEGSYDCTCRDKFIGNGITCLSKYIGTYYFILLLYSLLLHIHLDHDTNVIMIIILLWS